MAVAFNHTIVHSRDEARSSSFLADLLGLPSPTRFGPFWVVALSNGVSLDYLAAGEGPIAMQHYAFLIGETEFDAVYARIRERGLEHWADPYQSKPGEINRHDGGRGVYFEDPDGHLLEVLTRPYGSSSGTQHGA